MGSEESDVDCNETIERLYHYLDGELTDERRVEIKRHLDDCAPCLDAFDFEAELRVRSSPTAARTTSPRRCASGSTTPSSRRSAARRRADDGLIGLRSRAHGLVPRSPRRRASHLTAPGHAPFRPVRAAPGSTPDSQRSHNERLTTPLSMAVDRKPDTTTGGRLRGMEDRTEWGDQSIGAKAFTGYGRPSRTFAVGPGLRRAGLRDEAVDLQRRRVLLPAPTPAPPGCGARRSPDGPPRAGRLRRARIRLPTLGVVTSPVSWDVAERVATWVGTRGSLFGPSRRRDPRRRPPWPSSRRTSPRPPPRPRPS